jgi:hypothetical protein
MRSRRQQKRLPRFVKNETLAEGAERARKGDEAALDSPEISPHLDAAEHRSTRVA